MLRSLLIVAAAAALGALSGTLGLSLIAEGTGAPDPARFIFGFAVTAMIFTIPGAIMLAGLQAILVERGLADGHRDALIVLFGALAGALILAFIALHAAGVGAFYGLSTAVALVCLQRLVRSNQANR